MPTGVAVPTNCVDPMIVVLPEMPPVTNEPLKDPGRIGNEKGAAVGVSVDEPITITGAVADSSGKAVPVKVAVTVVEDMTSVRVTTPAGRAEEVGLVVCYCD